jgi:hypothetical protein
VNRSDGDRYAGLSTTAFHAHDLPLAVQAKGAVKRPMFQEQGKADGRPVREGVVRLEKEPEGVDIARDAASVFQFHEQWN